MMVPRDYIIIQFGERINNNMAWKKKKIKIDTCTAQNKVFILNAHTHPNGKNGGGFEKSMKTIPKGTRAKLISTNRHHHRPVSRLINIQDNVATRCCIRKYFYMYSRVYILRPKVRILKYVPRIFSILYPSILWFFSLSELFDEKTDGGGQEPIVIKQILCRYTLDKLAKRRTSRSLNILY